MAESFFSPCPRGLESLLAKELRACGATSTSETHGGVAWEGDWHACYRANLESRLATRVLWKVAEGHYRSEAEIYKLACETAWTKWFSPDERFRIYVTASKSPLKSLAFATLRVKDAVCDHFRAAAGRRPDVDTSAPDVRIFAYLTANRVLLYLDTSGEPLYKRGFKPAAVKAPLKENLAAGILMLTGWHPAQPLIDPMCGSGTFLLEAAQMALGIAPGAKRRFAFEKLRHFDRSTWRAIRDTAKQAENPVAPLPLFGSDIAAARVEDARRNLASAGLENCVKLEQADILVRPAPESDGVLVCNPPYGVRVGEQESLEDFYPKLGDALKARWAGWRCYFLSADPLLAKRIHLKATGRTPLFNGALECRLYEYRIVSGSLRQRD